MKKDIWKTNPFAIAWREKLAKKKNQKKSKKSGSPRVVGLSK